MHPMFSECLPGAAAKMLSYVFKALGEPDAERLAGNSGMPENGLECAGVKLSLFATPVTEQLFGEALLRHATTRRQCALLIRHGFHPETLDPVRVDVAVPLRIGSGLLSDLSFYRNWDGRLHLVPARAGVGISITHRGLKLQRLPPWNDMDERVEGLERAAAEIVRLSRHSAVNR